MWRGIDDVCRWCGDHDWYASLGNDLSKGVRCWSLRLCKVSDAASHSPARLQLLLCFFCLGRLDELLEISQLLISSIDFSKTQIYIYIFPSAELKMLKMVHGSPQTGWIQQSDLILPMLLAVERS